MLFLQLTLRRRKGQNRDKDEKEVEYIKSVIKVAFSFNFLLSSVLADMLLGQYRHRSPDDNPKRAFEILHSRPERVVDAAFYNLSITKTISHKKGDRLRSTPGPNYEFTDKFHMALKTPMDENLFAQAVAYDRYLGGGFTNYKGIEISSLTNNRSMACILAMVASPRV